MKQNVSFLLWRTQNTELRNTVAERKKEEGKVKGSSEDLEKCVVW